MTDAELMELVQMDDLSHLGELYRRYSLKLYRYFLKGTGDTAQSEDLTQLVFEKVLKARHTYRYETVFAGWLFTIARNTMIETLRRRSKLRTEAIDNYDVTDDHDQMEKEIIEDRKLKLAWAMEQLKDEHREIIQLTRFENLNYQEVAEYIGISETGVKARVFRAMKNLKKVYFAMN